MLALQPSLFKASTCYIITRCKFCSDVCVPANESWTDQLTCFCQLLDGYFDTFQDGADIHQTTNDVHSNL